MMKKISIGIPTFNEEGNVKEIYSRITDVMKKLGKYDYEIIFSDNDSKDATQDILRGIAKEDKHVKVIIHQRNFGVSRSGYNQLQYISGDALIQVCADLQEPVEMIEMFIKYWEAGNPVVWGQAIGSKESKLKWLCRKIYYHILTILSDSPVYQNATSFGIVDRKIVDLIASLDEPYMSIRYLVPELGYPVLLLPYEKNERKSGKSSYNLYRSFDWAVTTAIQISRVPLRLVTILGTVFSILSFLFGSIYLVYKLIAWDNFQAGIAPLFILVAFLGSVQLLSLGVIGEYIGNILNKVQKRPLVVVKELINFENEEREE